MWKRFVRQLIKSGLTQAEIAHRTGFSQPSISKMFRGEYKVGPRGERGTKLLALHWMHCGTQDRRAHARRR